jgi:hypothetical protein
MARASILEVGVLNFFLQIRESVIDFKFYRSIKDNKFSRSFVYLLLLFLIIYFINGTKTFIITRIGIDEMMTGLSNMPDFRLENGEFIFDGEMPYYFGSNSNEGFVIDTTGRLGEEALSGVNTGMLITKDKLFVKRSAVEMREFNLKEFNTITISRNDILLIFIAFGFIFVLGWKLLNAVFLALIALAANAIMGGRLKFNNLVNISIYALTLPMLLQLAVNLYGYPVPYFGLIYWGISILYAAMAINSCKDEDNELYAVNNPEE